MKFEFKLKERRSINYKMKSEVYRVSQLYTLNCHVVLDDTMHRQESWPINSLDNLYDSFESPKYNCTSAINQQCFYNQIHDRVSQSQKNAGWLRVESMQSLVACSLCGLQLMLWCGGIVCYIYIVKLWAKHCTAGDFFFFLNLIEPTYWCVQISRG